MNKLFALATAGLAVFTLSSCGGGSGGSGGGGSADSVGLAGAWESELADKTESAGTLKAKVRMTFTGDAYTYSWYKKLVGPDNNPIYDWTEVARETGSASFAPEYMEWTAESFGEAEYNEGTRSWSALEMKSAGSDYAIKYAKEGDKVITREDINLDGDFDDMFDTPETITYSKVAAQ
jgi:hypothetical protein